MTGKKQSKINQSNTLEKDKKSSSEQTRGLALPTEKDLSKVNQSESIRTLGSMMGEMVWLMSQSPIYKQLTLGDLEWLLMPPIILGQYKLFRDSEKKPVGAALWGYLSPEAEEKLKTVGRLDPQDWGNNAKLDPEQGLVATEGGTLWLVELITPFHSQKNQHREQILKDLVTNTLTDQPLKMMHFNTQTMKREEITLSLGSKE